MERQAVGLLPVLRNAVGKEPGRRFDADLPKMRDMVDRPVGHALDQTEPTPSQPDTERMPTRGQRTGNQDMTEKATCRDCAEKCPNKTLAPFIEMVATKGTLAERCRMYRPKGTFKPDVVEVVSEGRPRAERASEQEIKT